MDGITESQTRRLLAAAYDAVPDGGDLLGRVRRRHARRRARVRGTLATGSAAVITAGALFASTATGAPSALAAATSAITKTSAGSFHVSLAVSAHNGGPGSPTPSSPFRMTGEFDLTRHLGQENMSNGWQMLFVGGQGYVRLPHARWAQGSPSEPVTRSPNGKPWFEEPVGTAELDPAQLAWDFNSDVPIDPSALLGLLNSAGAIHDQGPVSGPGWTGTKYGFTVRNPVNIVQSVIGTMYVDSTGRLRRLVQTVTFTPFIKPAGPAEVLTLDFAFSDFGARVAVSAPPADQVFHGHGVALGVQF